MFAESPMVEVRRHVGSEDGNEVLIKEILALKRRVGKKEFAKVVRVPFPLQGRLDEWIRAIDPEDTTLKDCAVRT